MITRRRFLQAGAAAGAWLAWPYRAVESRRIDIVSHIPRPWPGQGPEPADWNQVPNSDQSPNSRFRVMYQPTRRWVN